MTDTLKGLEERLVQLDQYARSEIAHRLESVQALEGRLGDLDSFVRMEMSRRLDRLEDRLAMILQFNLIVPVTVGIILAFITVIVRVLVP